MAQGLPLSPSPLNGELLAKSLEQLLNTTDVEDKKDCVSEEKTSSPGTFSGPENWDASSSDSGSDGPGGGAWAARGRGGGAAGCNLSESSGNICFEATPQPLKKLDLLLLRGTPARDVADEPISLPMPAYVDSSYELPDVGPTHEAAAQAVAAILQALPMAQEKLAKELGGGSADAGSTNLLVEVVTHAIGSLKRQQEQPKEADPAAKLTAQLANAARLAQSQAVANFMTPAPPGLERPPLQPPRAGLRSSARPFVSGFCAPEAPPGGPSCAARPVLTLAGRVTTGPAGLDVPNGETMRGHLQELQGKDHRRVLIVRKIQKLGFDSPAQLKGYFEWYGPVERVLVSHSHVRNLRRVPATRIRPAHLGFVVMLSVEGAKKVLADGKVHPVDGVPIEVSDFVPQHGEGAAAEGDDDAGCPDEDN